MNSEKKTLVEELISDLKQQRDEVRVKLNLGNKELHDEWERLDDRLNQLTSRFEPLKNAVEETAAEVWDSLQLVGNELKDGFNRIKQAL